MPAGPLVNALGSDSILQYPRYKLNAYVVAISFVAATGGLLFGTLQLVPQLASWRACLSMSNVHAQTPAETSASTDRGPAAGYDIGVTGGVTTNNDFLALFFPDVHHHVAAEKGAGDSVYCKARRAATPLCYRRILPAGRAPALAAQTQCRSTQLLCTQKALCLGCHRLVLRAAHGLATPCAG